MWPLYVLAPHALSLGAFLGAFYVISVVGHNRSDLDLTLGQIGYASGIIGIVMTLFMIFWVISRRGDKWPWLVVHLGALAGVVWAGFQWLGMHIA
ncbi:MAG: hypothetical protein AAGD34_10340 [Pseudomonadota bacterium]